VNKWGGTVLLCAAVVAWQIYEMAGATEEPSQAVLILHYIVLGCALIGLVGASANYFSEKPEAALKRPGPAPRAPASPSRSGARAAPASAADPEIGLPDGTPGLVGAAQPIGPLTRRVATASRNSTATLFLLGGVGLVLATGLIWTIGARETEMIRDPGPLPPPTVPQVTADEAFAKAKEAEPERLPPPTVPQVSVSEAFAKAKEAEPERLPPPAGPRISPGESFAKAKEAYRRRDYAEALRGFREAAGQGDAAAEVNLGTLYAFGHGVPQDYAEALVWFRKAADQGLPEAQFDIAIAYEEGQGVPQNYAEAARWYQKAADQGLDRAQNNLGLLYHDGQGVARDYREAFRWYRSAAGQGYAAAQLHIGTMYAMGQGIARDYAEGLLWYRRAADQGVPAAQYNVGLIYANGLGVTADHAEARLWMEKAAAGGNDRATAWLKANQPK
jgi:TPR repeat protein